MFERIGRVYQCFKGWGLNSNVRKDKAAIPMSERAVPE